MTITGSTFRKAAAALLSTIIVVTASGDGRAFGPKPAPFPSGGRWGYMDVESQKIFIEPEYELACPFSGDLAAVRINGKWGFIDQTGRMAIPPAYEAVAPSGFFSYRKSDEDLCGEFTGDVAAVKVDGLWGLIDNRGEVLLKPGYTGVIHRPYIGTKSTPTERNMKAWYFHQTKRYDWLIRTAEIVAPVRNGRLVAVMTTKEAFADVAEKYFPGGLKSIERGGKWGYINIDNEVVVEPVYDEAADFSDGMARMRKGDRWGFIDTDGRVMVEATLEDARDFVNGPARVKSQGRWGFIDKGGEFVIKPVFDYCWDFSGDKAKVRLEDGSMHYIDRSGKHITE